MFIKSSIGKGEKSEMKGVNSNNYLSNILCGIISSLISIPVTTLLKAILNKLTPNELSFPLFCAMFALVIISIFLLIKFLLTKKAFKDICNHINSMEILKEIKTVYPNSAALRETLIDLLPQASRVNILDLRGFYYTQQDSPLFRIISASSKTEFRILLSEPDSANTIYRANHIPNKPEMILKNEIQASIDTITSLNKNNVKLKLYHLHNVTRLIFIDDELFLTPFRDGDFLAHAPTFRIPNTGTLFKCYQDYFSEIWNNQSNKVLIK